MDKRSRSRSSSKKRQPKKTRNDAPSTRRLGTNGPVRAVTLGGLGIPDKVKTFVRYVQYQNLSGTPSVTTQVFRANSLYDPDVTGGGHQPLNYDQWAAWFSEYVVLKCMIDFDCINGGTSQARVVVAACEVNTASNSWTENAEAQYARTFNLTSGVGGRPGFRLRDTISIPKLVGQRDVESDPSFYTGFSANPQDPVYVWIAAQSIDGSSACAISATFTITYQCVLKERKDPTSSLIYDRSVSAIQSAKDKYNAYMAYREKLDVASVTSACNARIRHLFPRVVVQDPLVSNVKALNLNNTPSSPMRL